MTKRRRFRTLGVVLSAVALAACTPSDQGPRPPAGFPDLTKFAAVDPSHYTLGGTAFVTPDQVTCVLDYGPRKSTVCSGEIQGLPTSVSGTGCPVVRKVDESSSNAPYVLRREEPGCASSRVMPIHAGQKLIGANGTCAVGEDDLVACIDADFKHGFVLKPSGSWAF